MAKDRLRTSGGVWSSTLDGPSATGRRASATMSDAAARTAQPREWRHVARCIAAAACCTPLFTLPATSAWVAGGSSRCGRQGCMGCARCGGHSGRGPLLGAKAAAHRACTGGNRVLESTAAHRACTGRRGRSASAHAGTEGCASTCRDLNSIINSTTCQRCNTVQLVAARCNTVL